MGFVMLITAGLLPRDPLPDSLMGSCLVEVLLVLGDEPTKMLVIEDDHVVENLPFIVAFRSCWVVHSWVGFLQAAA